VFEQVNGKHEGEEKLVFLEQRATNVAVQGVGEMSAQIGQSVG